MPRVSLSTTYKACIRDIDQLRIYIDGSIGMEAKYQYLIAEVVMLRLFAILEHGIKDVALKLACGAEYTNGRLPTVLIPCRSMDDAANKMLTLRPRRDRPRYLKWTKDDFVEKSIRYVLDIRDTFFVNIQNNAILLNEMRVVRNELAHRTRGTRSEYLLELQRIYGVHTRLTVGPFLTSTARHTLSNVERYILSTPIMLNDFIRG